LFGIPAHESVCYDKVITAIHAEDRARVLQTLQKASLPETGGIYELEYRVIGLTDQKLRWVCSRGKIVFDDNNIVERYTGVVQDVTAKKNREEELLVAHRETDKLKRLYEAVTGSTPDLVYVLNLNYQFTYANPSLLAMWGKSWEEAIGKNLRQLGYEDWHAAMHESEIDEVIATKKTVRGWGSFHHDKIG